jgi:hypothetical protein
MHVEKPLWVEEEDSFMHGGDIPGGEEFSGGWGKETLCKIPLSGKHFLYLRSRCLFTCCTGKRGRVPVEMDLDPGELVSEVYYKKGILFLRTDNVVDPCSYRVRKAVFFVDEKRCYAKGMHVFDERKRREVLDVSIGTGVLVLLYDAKMYLYFFGESTFLWRRKMGVPKGATKIAGMDEREESVFLEGAGKWMVGAKKREVVAVDKVRRPKDSVWRWARSDKGGQVMRMFLDKRNLLEVTEKGLRHMVLSNKREVFREEIEMACLDRKGISVSRKGNGVELRLGNICASYGMEEHGQRVEVEKKIEIEPVLPQSENRGGRKIEEPERNSDRENRGDFYSNGDVSVAIKDMSVEVSIGGKAVFMILHEDKALAVALSSEGGAGVHSIHVLRRDGVLCTTSLDADQMSLSDPVEIRMAQKIEGEKGNVRIEVCGRGVYLWIIFEKTLVLYEMSWRLAEKGFISFPMDRKKAYLVRAGRGVAFYEEGALKGRFSLSNKKELVYQPIQEEVDGKDLSSSMDRSGPGRKARRDGTCAIGREDGTLLLFQEEGAPRESMRAYPSVYADHIELVDRERVLVVEDTVIWVFSAEEGKAYLKVDMRKRLHSRISSALLVNKEIYYSLEDGCLGVFSLGRPSRN